MRQSFVPIFLVLSSLAAQPALAQDDHVRAVQGLERVPAGVSARVGVTVPIGRAGQGERRATFAVTADYGQRFESERPLGIERTRGMELFQLNFDGEGARDLQFGNVSLTQFGRDDVEGAQANLGSTGATIAVVGGVALIALVLVALSSTPPDY